MVERKRGWKSLLKRAGLDSDYRLHNLRRTMGSWKAITGSSGKIIGASLGHKTEQATSVYTRLTIDPVRDSMTRAVSVMTGKAEEQVVERVKESVVMVIAYKRLRRAIVTSKRVMFS